MKYEEYKDINVGWINKIPSHWYTIPIKYTVKNPVASFIDGDWIESKVIESDGIRYLTTGNIGVLEYKEQGSGFISEETFSKLNCTEVFPGDLLISRLNEPIARTCIVPDLGYRIVVAVDNVIYRPETTLYNKRFIMYQMNCTPYTVNASFIARGSTMPRISRTMLGAIKLCIPPLAEQEVIATYLDEKCGEINRAIDVQRKKTELLGELKQTIITDAVTKGLNPNAPMKGSGVEWIGKVPIHWEVMRLRFACEFRNGYTPSKANPDFWENGSIPWYRMEDIRESGRFLNEAKQYITRKAVKGNGLFEAGSFILATTATIGEHAVLIAESLANQRFTNLKIRKSLSNRLSRDFFFYYLFVIDDYCKSTTRTATFPAVNMDDLKNFGVTIPPLQEQQAIVAHIEDEVGKIDSRISRANRRIELLEELKQSIITEAVTGKIKVC